MPSPDDETASASLPRRRTEPPHLDRLRGRRELGRYRLTELIGAGGMGVVYRGHDPTLARELAIKLVRLRHADPVAQARLIREAQAMARLAHPNVLPIFDVGTLDDDVYLVMPFLPGGSLRGWLRAAPRAWPEVVARFVAAGRGLAAAHDAGLVHRDFKPDNVLLGAKGEVQVADFGLASRGEDSDDAVSAPTLAPGSVPSELTRSGDVLGTPAYMAPEQMRGEPVDARADQFAYCVALYEAVYGGRPFDDGGRGGAAALDALHGEIAAGRVRPPPADAAVPGWLHQAVVRGLSAAPADRWPAMSALVDHLERRAADATDARAVAAAPGAATAPTVASAPVAVAPPPVRVPRRRWAWVAAAVAVAVAVLATRDGARPRPAVEGEPDAALAHRCDAADAAACAELARRELRHLDGPPDFAAAYTRALRGCDLGDPAGCAIAADLLLWGNGVNPDLARARALATDACDRGAGDGCVTLGELRRRADPSDHAGAVAALRRGCELGAVVGCDEAARVLRHGLGVPADADAAAALDARAATLAERGCVEGDPAACRSRGLAAYHTPTGDRARAAGDLRRACELGAAQACGDAGQLFVIGEGVQPDPARGVALLRRGCDGGSPDACEALIVVLEFGHGVPKDAAGARRLAERECEQRGDLGCNSLAQLYQLGIGVPTDVARARELAARACRGGDGYGCDTVGALTARDDEAAARRAWQRGCDLGAVTGCLSLGKAAARAGDDATAFAADRLACDLGDGSMCAPLAGLYFTGRGVERDPARGRALLDRGCAAQDPLACDALATRLRDGDGVPADRRAAENLFEKACALSWARSCAAAADLLADGTLPADPTRAAELRQKACDAEPTRYCPAPVTP